MTVYTSNHSGKLTFSGQKVTIENEPYEFIRYENQDGFRMATFRHSAKRETRSFMARDLKIK